MHMLARLATGLIAATTVSLALLAPAGAADLYGGDRAFRGSIKDDPMAMPRSPAGACYIRGDVGYSFSNKPDMRWPVTDPLTGDFVTDKISDLKIEDTWLAEGGVGCAAGNSGWRGEITFGVRYNREISGEPGLWAPVIPVTGDPIHANVQTYTLMLNAYRDLGSWGNFTPYVGAGLGLAYHIVEDVYFTDNLNLVNAIEGDKDLAFAWQLMAGVGYRIADNAVLDIGYRYVDLGKATSGRADNAGFVNPRVVIDDMTAHELKIGLRFELGGDRGYSALK